MKYLILIAISFITLPVFSQTYNGKLLIWDFGTTLDKRIQVRMGSGGYSFGTEGTTLQVKNIGTKKIYLKFKQTFTDFCGNEKQREFSLTVNPNEVVGGSTFFGGWEQYDYTTNCKERKKYADNFGTAIKVAKLELISAREEGEPVNSSGNGTNNNNSGSVNNNQPVQPVNGQSPCPCPCPDAQGSSDCPTVNFTCGDVGARCASLKYFEQKYIVYNQHTGDIKTDNTPTNYIVQYRKAGDLNWIERIPASNMTYSVSDLEPCTKYEVRMLRDCGGGKRSIPSGILSFTTTCPEMPSFQMINITSSSATVSLRMPSTFLGAGCGYSILPKLIFEYKREGGVWESVFCTSGKGSCGFFGLTPNTGYRVRAKRDYGNGKYSGYTNEIYFKTKSQ